MLAKCDFELNDEGYYFWNRVDGLWILKTTTVNSTFEEGERAFLGEAGINMFLLKITGGIRMNELHALFWMFTFFPEFR